MRIRCLRRRSCCSAHWPRHYSLQLFWLWRLQVCAVPVVQTFQRSFRLVAKLCLTVAIIAFTLFFGRFIQAIASAFIWTVGYATIADNVKQEHLGKTYGMISLVVAVGTSGGPMAAGILFEMGGYWLAWSSAFAIIVVDIVLRALMIERPRSQPGECLRAIRPSRYPVSNLEHQQVRRVATMRIPRMIPFSRTTSALLRKRRGGTFTHISSDTGNSSAVL